jgi:hypothetical protein
MPTGVYLRLSKPVGNRTNNKCGGRPKKHFSKEEIASSRKEKYKTDPDHRRNIQSRMLRRHIGKTLDEYDAQLKAQNNLCDACKKPLGMVDKRDPWDHNHETREVRGIVHKGCNIAIGEANEDPTTLRLLAEYVEKYRAKG